ncbi:hypothetical protein EL06_20875 [Salmonella enterica subsp. diarizonae]|uniref:Uncharacterized protein n=1 Tax=Salmonella diarizonae TaxID=59204 RepID=A0A6C8Y2H4_SALDZ|nr:hypothetical protein [Salmonella enterica subsp. diarizonae]
MGGSQVERLRENNRLAVHNGCSPDGINKLSDIRNLLLSTRLILLVSVVRWHEDERVLLEQNQHLILAELQKLFPGRSRQALYHARARLKNNDRKC